MIRQSRRLMVGTSGSANSFGTIQSVRDHYGDSVLVIATDTNRRELVAASVLADAFVQVPLARPSSLKHSVELLHHIRAAITCRSMTMRLKLRLASPPKDAYRPVWNSS